MTALETTVAVLESTVETNETQTQEQAEALATTRAELDAAQDEVERYQATPTTASPVPVESPSPAPMPAGAEMSLASDLAAWPLPDGWNREGGLSTDGGGDAPWVIAPITVTSTNDYAVEVSFIVEAADTCPRNFGVAIRGSDAGYYAGGIEWGCDPVVRLWAGQNVLAEQPIELSDGPHVLRVEAIGDQISVSLDGAEIVTATDASVPAGGQIALWSSGVPITITNVDVIELGGSAEHSPPSAARHGIMRDEEAHRAPAV